jgi:hypothetical protein
MSINKKSASSHFRVKVEIEHSNTQVKKDTPTNLEAETQSDCEFNDFLAWHTD